MTDHSGCPDVLVSRMAAMGVAVTAQTSEPMSSYARLVGALVCPHGQRYWLVPTTAQVDEWVRLDVP